MTDIPAHRHSFAARSGDTHVIGKDGKAVNIDQKARDEAAPRKRVASETKKPAARKRSRAKKPAAAAPAPAPAPTPSGE